jgi:hypothetical protein
MIRRNVPFSNYSASFHALWSRRDARHIRATAERRRKDPECTAVVVAHDGIGMNLVSWTSSLLFALHYGLHCARQKNPDNLQPDWLQRKRQPVQPEGHFEILNI